MAKSVAFEEESTSVRVLVPSRETGGAYTICIIETDGPVSAPARLHSYEDQWYQVLEGQFEFETGDGQIRGGPGTTVAIPRQTVSKVARIGEGKGKLLVVALPGGLDLFFGDMRASLDGGSGIAPVLEKHGIVVAEGGIERMQSN